jgi:hypothetical protein
MYYVTFIHPKYGEQHTDRPTKKEIVKWLSYMIFAHEIYGYRIYEGGKELAEGGYIGGKEVALKIPKY